MISVQAIATTTAAAVGLSLLAITSAGTAASRQPTEVVVTPAQDTPTKGGHVFYDDGRKLYINADCKGDIVAAGLDVRLGTIAEVQSRSYVVKRERETCAEVIAGLEAGTGPSTTTPPTTTPPTTAPPTTTPPTTTPPTTAPPTTAPPSGSSVVLYVTSGTVSPTRGGFVVTDQSTWTHIDKDCKARLHEHNIDTFDAVWTDVSQYRRDQSITCDDIVANIGHGGHGHGSGDWVTVADEAHVTYTDGRTREKYFFFDPDDHTDPTWGRSRIGWLVECDSVKFQQVDPIVAPGVTSPHLHEFFGQADVSSTSTTQTFVDTPRSEIACTDVNDKSAYWSPVVYQDGKRVKARKFKAYYKSTTVDAVPMPLGLRIVAGNAHATENQDSVVGWFEEQRTNDLTPKEDLTNTIGATEMITRQNDSVNIVLRINFPNCWDGVHLDSPDHQSHMAYFDEETLTCPATHPVKIPQLTTFTQYDADGGEGFSLSSGEWFTFHQDFWNAWSPDQMAELTQRCITDELNCRVQGSNALKRLGQYSAYVPETSS